MRQVLRNGWPCWTNAATLNHHNHILLIWAATAGSVLSQNWFSTCTFITTHLYSPYTLPYLNLIVADVRPFLRISHVEMSPYPLETL